MEKTKYMYVHVYLPEFVYLCIYVCLYTYICLYIYMHIHMCAYYRESVPVRPAASGHLALTASASGSAATGPLQGSVAAISTSNRALVVRNGIQFLCSRCIHQYVRHVDVY